MNIKNILIGSFITVLIATISAYFPILGIAVIFIPINLAIISKKEDLNHGIIALMISILVVSILLGIFNAIFISCFGFLNLLVLFYNDKLKMGPLKAQILLTISILLSFTCITYLVSVVTDVSIIGMFTKNLVESKEILISNSMINTEELDYNLVVDQIISIVPFLVILISTINASIMYFIHRNFLKRMGYEVIEINKLSQFKLPMHFIYGTTFIIFLSYIVSKMNIIDFESISLNIILIMIYIFAFQGLAVLFYFFDKKNINNFVKGIIVLLIFLFQGLFILSVLGWLDMIFNFRRTQKSN